MPITINKVEDPCQACRERHLKCDDGRPKCKQCERLDQDCNRLNGKHKFRWGSSARHDQNFAKDQIWLTQSRNAKIQFVDQGPELENFYATDEPDESLPRVISPTAASAEDHTTDARPLSLHSDDAPHYIQDIATSETNILSPSARSVDSGFVQPAPKRRKVDDATTQLSEIGQQRPRSSGLELDRFYVVREPKRNSGSLAAFAALSPTESQVELRLKRVHAEYERLEDTHAAEVPPEELLSPEVWKKHFIWPNKLTTTQCTCLMRYYTDYLGPWLDVGDPSRHFTLLVPQRAQRCPPLLNAIFTIAARHLSHLSQFKTKDGIVRYHSNLLPKLDDRQAIKYQNASIAYLKELCKDMVHVQDEDLLAATVILRYYEELDSSLNADHDETVMRPLQLFVAAQTKPNFPSQLDYTPLDGNIAGSFSSGRADIEAYVKGYQHASLRIALRQECARAFMKQKAIGLPLHLWGAILEGFDEADDIIWADRHLYHLAQVLQFCFHEDEHGQWNTGRWYELKEFEQQWEANKPVSFAAFHYKDASLTPGKALPEIWYLSEIHAAATQYFHLSRILLAVYNPTIPRLGPGAKSASKKMSEEVREHVRELCGVARSIEGSEPALFQAYMAIALCGEHFTVYRDQVALMQILLDLESQYGFPTGNTAETLKQSWSWEA